MGAVKLLDGTDLDADIVILGIGSNFNTQWLSKSGIKMSSNGTLEVNKVNVTKACCYKIYIFIKITHFF